MRIDVCNHTLKMFRLYGKYGENIFDLTQKLLLMYFVSGVKLAFTGSAYVHWTETHQTGSGKNRRTETRHYSASETYFNFELLLYGPGCNF